MSMRCLCPVSMCLPALASDPVNTTRVVPRRRCCANLACRLVVDDSSCRHHQDRYIAAIYGTTQPQLADAHSHPSTTTSRQSLGARIFRMMSRSILTPAETSSTSWAEMARAQPPDVAQHSPSTRQDTLRWPLAPMRSLGQTLFGGLLSFANMRASPEESIHPERNVPMPELAAREASWTSWLESPQSAWNLEASTDVCTALRPGGSATTKPALIGPLQGEAGLRSQFAASDGTSSNAPALHFHAPASEARRATNESSLTGSENSSDARCENTRQL
jgi:hypothetical protein